MTTVQNFPGSPLPPIWALTQHPNAEGPSQGTGTAPQHPCRSSPRALRSRCKHPGSLQLDHPLGPPAHQAAPPGICRTAYHHALLQPCSAWPASAHTCEPLETIPPRKLSKGSFGNFPFSKMMASSGDRLPTSCGVLGKFLNSFVS